MDAGALKAFERYRPWLQLGLRHILLAEDSALTGSYTDAARPQGPPVTRPPARPSGHAAPASGDVPRAEPSAPVFPRPRPRPRREKQAQPAAAAPDPAHPRTGSVAPAPDSGPDWTAIWRRYRSKLMIPSRTLWTYRELGFDLGDAPDATRRDLFRRIMQALSWPPGSIGFWPVAFQWRGDLVPRRELFLRGLREAGAHTIVCFGAGAHAILFDDRPYRLETTTLGESTVIVLPGPEDMLGPQAEQAKRTVWEHLKDYKPD